jgi:hypothetical protein
MKLMPGWMIAVWLLVIGTVALAEEKSKPRPQTHAGQLTKVEGNALTVTQRGDKGERSETFTVAADTKILIETAEDETVKVKGEGGERTITRPKVQEGKITDLKVGQRVSVTYAADRKVTQVTGHRPPKPRKGEGQ